MGLELEKFTRLPLMQGSTEYRQIPVVIMSSENIPTRITKYGNSH